MKLESNFLKNMHFGVKNQFSGILKFLRIFWSDLVGAMAFWKLLVWTSCSYYLEMISNGPSMQLLLAHLSQRLIDELIGYPWSGVCCRPSVHNFKRLLLGNRLANQSQILCWSSLGRGNRTNVYINGPGHLTKMAVMPIYGKNFKKNSYPEPEVLWSWNLACIIGDSTSTMFIQMMTLGWPWPI